MLYIGNAFFEMELEGQTPPDLLSAFKINPIIEQLQYLPLLYLGPDETLLVAEYPSREYLENLKSYGILNPPQMVLEKDIPKHSFQKIESWGSSELIEKWAARHNIPYDAPPLASARRMNSKLYHFEHTPKLPYGSIVNNEKELLEALQNPVDKWVLKTDQGFSGRGHCIFTRESKEKGTLWTSQHQKLVLEPWVERICDFSSQWAISKDGEATLLGVTKCLNTPHGVYQGTETGKPEILFGGLWGLISEHLEFCKSYLRQHMNGYFGVLGVDAMIYKGLQNGSPTLHPLVEVNARMTLASALLLFFERHLKKSSCRFLFQACNKGTVGLLPFVYKRQLTIQK
jgi:hypothetical protein